MMKSNIKGLSLLSGKTLSFADIQANSHSCSYSGHQYGRVISTGIITLIGSSVLLQSCSVKDKNQQSPNIVFILTDDLGYGDLSCLNPDSKIKTPNIDLIASAGITFTDAHSGSAVSTPTRYGIMTGRYSWRSDLKSSVLDGYSTSLIPQTRTTMAGMLKISGYTTA